MSLTVSTIATKLGLKYQGKDIEITGCNSLEEAKPNEISFLANPKYTKMLSTTQAGAVILEPQYAHLIKNCIISNNPYRDFARTIHFFAKNQGCFSGISDFSYIHPESEIATDVAIYPFVFIGAKTKIESGCTLYSGVYIGEECYIGANSTLYPNVALMAGTKIGKSVILHSGVVIGSDGFGFAQNVTLFEKIPQIGNVTIEDNVEIGANTTVDRATLGETRICKGTKIDNLVQIGHNVHVGENSILVAQVGIAGSSKIGKNVILAGQVGVSGHIKIGDNCKVGAKSGVNKSIKPNLEVSGYPVMEHKKFLRCATLQSKLPDIYNKIKKLESEIEHLQSLMNQKGDEND